jgi:chromosome segregation ATPase
MSGIAPADSLAQASSGNLPLLPRPYLTNQLPEAKSTKKRRKKGAKEKANGDIKGISTPGESHIPSKITEAEVDDDSQPEETSQVTPQPSTPQPLPNGTQKASMTESAEHAAARFEVLVKDRDALRVEVAQLRQSLEELQVNHQTSLGTVRQELQETQTEKEHAEEQYQTLLGRVNTIKSQLGERLKADAVGLTSQMQPSKKLMSVF